MAFLSDFKHKDTGENKLKKETYKKMIQEVSETPFLLKGVVYSDKVLTKVSYALYPIFLIYLFASGKQGIYAYVAVPAVSFAAVSIFRYILCAPRPYEVFDTAPVIKKDTKGKSFPSRHVFSAFAVAASIFHFCRPLGTALGILGLVLAAARVLGGVHFIKDVAAGCILGTVMTAAGFYFPTGSF